MKIRPEKSNLVGRIRKILMKEMMLDMWGIWGNIIGTNSTGRHFSAETRPVHLMKTKMLILQSRSHQLPGDHPFSRLPCFPSTRNLPQLYHLLHWICWPLCLLHRVVGSSSFGPSAWKGVYFVLRCLLTPGFLKVIRNLRVPRSAWRCLLTPFFPKSSGTLKSHVAHEDHGKSWPLHPEPSSVSAV